MGKKPEQVINRVPLLWVFVLAFLLHPWSTKSSLVYLRSSTGAFFESKPLPDLQAVGEVMVPDTPWDWRRDSEVRQSDSEVRLPAPDVPSWEPIFHQNGRCFVILLDRSTRWLQHPGRACRTTTRRFGAVKNPTNRMAWDGMGKDGKVATGRDVNHEKGWNVFVHHINPRHSMGLPYMPPHCTPHICPSIGVVLGINGAAVRTGSPR